MTEWSDSEDSASPRHLMHADAIRCHPERLRYLYRVKLKPVQKCLDDVLMIVLCISICRSLAHWVPKEWPLTSMYIAWRMRL